MWYDDVVCYILEIIQDACLDSSITTRIWAEHDRTWAHRMSTSSHAHPWLKRRLRNASSTGTAQTSRLVPLPPSCTWSSLLHAARSSQSSTSFSNLAPSIRRHKRSGSGGFYSAARVIAWETRWPRLTLSHRARKSSELAETSRPSYCCHWGRAHLSWCHSSTLRTTKRSMRERSLLDSSSVGLGRSAALLCWTDRSLQWRLDRC